MDKRKGITSIEAVILIAGSIAAAISYVHATFTTYREFSQIAGQVNRIEGKLDAALDKK